MAQVVVLAHLGHVGTVEDMARRRIVYLVVLAAAVIAMFVPLFWLEAQARSLNADPAFKALDAYAQAHNGNHAYDTKAAEALPGFVRTPLRNGKVRFAERSPRGVCWTLVVGPGRAGLPKRSPSSECP